MLETMLKTEPLQAVDWTAWVSTQRVGVPLDGSWSKLPFANELWQA